MQGIVYVNGEYLPAESATVSIFDRGFLFGDGAYEVVSVLKGHLVDAKGHLERLSRSLAELEIPCPWQPEELLQIIRNVADKNRLDEGMVYFQITRGAAPRLFHYPENPKPSLTVFSQKLALINHPTIHDGVRVVSTEDLRWKRRDIKSIALLPQCMGKQVAKKNDAYEAWMVEDGFVTEGTSSSAYIVKDNTVITRPISNKILAGITRRALLALAEDHKIRIEERLFSLEEAYQADEAFLSAATNFLTPVVNIDGHRVGDGRPGPIWQQLRDIYIEMATQVE